MKLLKHVMDTVLPRNCLICGRTPDADGRIPYPVPEDFHICFSCLSSIVPNPEDKRFFLCLSEPYEGDPVPGLGLYIPFPYKGFFEKAVPRMKFHSCPQLAEFAGSLLGSLMKKEGITADVMVPVPLSSLRLKERGYNQAELIAVNAALVAGIPYLGNILKRTRDTLRQTEITDNAERSLNVEGAFEVDESFDIIGLKIIVVDDVATTGNTLHEAALALTKAGAERVLCCAVCGNRAVLNSDSF